MLTMIMILVLQMSWKLLKLVQMGLHLTINGMGERAGNAPMASVIAVIKDFIPDVEICY